LELEFGMHVQVELRVLCRAECTTFGDDSTEAHAKADHWDWDPYPSAGKCTQRRVS
jgi:hypothetical protein